jgi:hypothetical protein
MEELIRQAIVKVLKSILQNGLVSGTATKVTDTTCTLVQDGKPDIEGVALNAYQQVEDSYVTVVPKEGSLIVVGTVDGEVTEQRPPVVIGCTEVQKVIWKCGDKTLVFDSSAMVINGGDNGGLPISGNVTDRLNKLEDFVNQFVSTYNSHTHPYLNVAAAATTSASAAAVSGTLTNTVVADIENPKVKH